MSNRVRVVAHEVRRLEIAVDPPFEEFRDRYEKAVPPFEPGHFFDGGLGGTDWATITRITERVAPHGFLLYWRNEVDLVMRVAGHRRRCTTYLMGNHTVAERMYRHDSGIMLYAPLRVTLHEDHDDRVWLTVDQPSTRFSSFGDPEIAAVGAELDDKLAALFTALDIAVPAELAG
ncbi:DUF302 domain-containing protein [Amycolatopsis sp. NPDC101161]|uniref:DUF302 domain-containing protein n=1 Tax=Amycolatopsis sp. NPDC101161 TaxID=3363940 RepID=UPI0037F4F681